MVILLKYGRIRHIIPTLHPLKMTFHLHHCTLLKSFLMIALLSCTIAPLFSEHSLLDLSSLEELNPEITDDRVMGGRSKGSATRTEAGDLLFSGILSLKNNGGFSSVWLQKTEMDLSAHTGITLRIKGDGRTYHLQIETDVMHRGELVSFQAPFETSEGEWITVTIPFKELVPTWRGDRLEYPFNPSNVSRFGIILLERDPGPFQLILAEIDAG